MWGLKSYKEQWRGERQLWSEFSPSMWPILRPVCDWSCARELPAKKYVIVLWWSKKSSDFLPRWLRHGPLCPSTGRKTYSEPGKTEKTILATTSTGTTREHHQIQAYARSAHLIFQNLIWENRKQTCADPDLRLAQCFPFELAVAAFWHDFFLALHEDPSSGLLSKYLVGLNLLSLWN